MTARRVALGVDIIEAHSGPVEKVMDRIDARAAVWGAYPRVLMLGSTFNGPRHPSTDLPARAFLPSQPFRDWLVEHEITPLVNWIPEDGVRHGDVMGRIAAGEHDEVIREWARGAAEWGHPVIARPPWEFNGTWFWWSQGSPYGATAAAFVAGWRRWHDLVRNAPDHPTLPGAGASNVDLFWCANQVDEDGAAPIEAYWPGDAWVEYTGTDLYRFRGMSQATPLAIGAPMLRRIRDLPADPAVPDGPRTRRPHAIGEMGVSDSFSPDERRAFVSGLPALAERFPRLRVICWFDIDASGIERPGRDWRLAEATGRWSTLLQRPGWRFDPP